MNLSAYFRLPFTDHYESFYQDYREAKLLYSFEELEGCEGFVVAPFQVTEQTPIILIEPDMLNTHNQFAGMQNNVPPIADYRDDRSAYSRDFAAFHRELTEGRMSKVVLSRTADIQVAGRFEYEYELFIRACQRYPRMFVGLAFVNHNEAWLTATPEVLLEGRNGQYHTMALAGTMRLCGDLLSGEGEQVRWAPKDIEEQRYVASYIADQLKAFGIDYQECGPRTVRAADLVHLRSDFDFALPADVPVSHVLQALHPTPAVCGLPKQESLQFILHHEQLPRRYYSGFMGLWNWEGNTRLYVTLRCMVATPDNCRLYAGGGLLKESTEEAEWLETEAKLQTMRGLFNA